MHRLIDWLKSFKKPLVYKYKRGDKVDSPIGVGIIFSRSDRMKDKTRPAYFILSESNDIRTYFSCDYYEDDLILIEECKGVTK
ncbi:hypothetical protein [Gilliamella sp. Gris1-4]|uniref:hypothetical protein n=1 Tax=Gilliamella sp. Gris1-4 TaxID=3120244 RepID=UPI00080EDEEC|nr:hypothetical protein [Gilliamella apicola]OCG36920.1 hypothetical protein A9G31_05180 [Gilliamella apicola]